jgi:CRP-like cAMP-binding protein
MKFICRGAAKYYMEDENGKYIISFLTEANHCAPIKSFYYHTKSDVGSVCTEDVYGIQISYEKFQQLIKERPAFDTLFNLLLQENMMFLKSRLKAFQSLDANERFNLLMKQSSEVLNRFSMLDIANYLGIKPETLSRLRRHEKIRK